MNTKRHKAQVNVYVEFRFLYGRWIQGTLREFPKFKPGSDSSMVDEYDA